jgi:hypothetical protein
VDPVPDPLLVRKSGSTGISGFVARNSDHQTTEAVPLILVVILIIGVTWGRIFLDNTLVSVIVKEFPGCYETVTFIACPCPVVEESSPPSHMSSILKAPYWSRSFIFLLLNFCKHASPLPCVLQELLNLIK